MNEVLNMAINGIKNINRLNRYTNINTNNTLLSFSLSALLAQRIL